MDDIRDAGPALEGMTPAWMVRRSMQDGPTRLHAGESPYGASPAVDDAIATQLPFLHRYPDTSSSELVGALARHHGVATEQVTVGNGLDEIILFLVLALGGEGKLGVVTDSTFQSYVKSLLVAQRPFVRCPLIGYRVPADDIALYLRRGDAFAFACNPHNPAGTMLRRAELEAMSDAAGEGGSTLIVDEAYAEYAGEDFASALSLAAASRHVCILRTFSKAYGLAGLRVGYLVGSPELVARVNEMQRPLPYHVNRLAQAAAVAALSDQEFVTRAARMVVATREWLARQLASMGLRCIPSATNFILVDLGGENSTATAARLREGGHLVRDTSDMGLPGHIRISIGTRHEMRALRDALASVLDAGGGQVEPTLASMRRVS